jgi:hypothetical protein
MQVHVVGKQIDRNRVVHADLHNLITRCDLYVFSFCRNFQVLHYFVHIVAYLIIRVAVHHRKTRLLLDFVGQLIFRRVGRHDLHRRVNSKGQNRGNDDGLNLACAVLASSRALGLWYKASSALSRANLRLSGLHASKLASGHTPV